MTQENRNSEIRRQNHKAATYAELEAQDSVVPGTPGCDSSPAKAIHQKQNEDGPAPLRMTGFSAAFYCFRESGMHSGYWMMSWLRAGQSCAGARMGCRQFRHSSRSSTSALTGMLIPPY